jgi:hypothetical protein
MDDTKLLPSESDAIACLHAHKSSVNPQNQIAVARTFTSRKCNTQRVILRSVRRAETNTTLNRRHIGNGGVAHITVLLLL